MILKSFKSLFELSHELPTEKACIAYYKQRRWPNGVISPFDPTSKVYHYRNGTYRCKNTGRNFNVKTDTMFEGSKIPLQKWFHAIWVMISDKKGISSCQLAEDIGVTQKTAWFMLQLIREYFDCENQHILDGEVELDETFVGGKNKNRHYNKKVKNSQGRSYKDKTPVFGMLKRKDKVVCRVVKNTSAKHLTPHIRKTVKPTATLYTDEWCGYDKIGKSYVRFKVEHCRGQYVKGRAHTNGIENFWSNFKRGILGTYHKTARKHLQKYVNEFVFRYNTRKIDGYARFNWLLRNTENRRITHKQLVA